MAIVMMASGSIPTLIALSTLPVAVMP